MTAYPESNETAAPLPLDMAGHVGGGLADMAVVNRDDSDGPGGSAVDPNVAPAGVRTEPPY